MKMLKLLFVGFVAFSTITLISCEPEDSADVNQDRIFTDYELFYDSNTDVSRALASFRFGTSILGTPLTLEDPAGVTFDGMELPYALIFLGHKLEIVGQITSGTFIYTNNDGENFINNLPDYNEIGFSADLTEINIGSAFELEWTGLPLGPNEEVAVFTGSFDTQDALFFTDAEGATSIILEKNKLESLTLGENTFYMERTLRVDAEEKTSAGGRMRVRYRTENKSITLTN